MTGGAARGFWCGQRGAVTIGAAVAISILVTTLASLMGIVHKVYIEDRMERGARAAARTISLAATAPASKKALEDMVCQAVERELGPDAGRRCACWNIEVEAFETPQALLGGHARAAAPHGGENADMVLVRIGRPYADWLPVTDAASADSGSETETSTCPDASKAAGIVVAAVARNEREVRVAQ